MSKKYTQVAYRLDAKGIRDWEAIDYKKVRARIREVIEAIQMEVS